MAKWLLLFHDLPVAVTPVAGLTPLKARNPKAVTLKISIDIDLNVVMLGIWRCAYVSCISAFNMAGSRRI